MSKKINVKKVFGYSFIAFSSIMMLYIIFKNNELSQVMQILRDINIKYIVVSVLCLFAFWFLEALMIYILITNFTDKTRDFKTFWLATKTTLIGQYYSNITPFASGGQPVQLYVMKDEDIPLSGGTAVLVSKFLLFQIGVTLYSLVLVLYRIKTLTAYINGIPIFIFTGLALNIIMLSLFILIALKPKLLTVLCEIFFEFLYKHKIIKNLNSTIAKTNSFISDYENSISKLKENLGLTVQLFLLTFVQLTIFFSITFFIYKSLNLQGSSIFEIICLQAFLYMAVSFIPTPGTAGVSEVGFVMILGNVFSKNIIGTALILWRGISYYFSLIFSGLFSLAVTAFSKKKRIA